MKRILLLLMAIVLIGCQNKYDIQTPTNGKFHGIIKIVNGEANCSAFVIDDEMAVTAGHCINSSSEWIKVIPEELKELNAKIVETQNVMLNIQSGCPMPGMCNGHMMQYDEELKKLLERKEFIENVESDKFKVYDINGKDTKIVAEALYKMNGDRDYGFVKGDFKKFNKLPVKQGFDVKVGDKLRMCGFPGGYSPATCIDFDAIGQHMASYCGKSMFVFGMSGGPVLDSDGLVVGIGVNLHEDKSCMTPILGIMSFE